MVWLNDLEQIAESVRVKAVIDGWLKAWSEKDADGILAPLSDGFVAHLPNSAPVIGYEGLKEFVGVYKSFSLGPVIHSGSVISVSGSGDLAYEVGRHDHVVYEKSGGSHLSPWSHIIVLKKVDGVWRIDGISETNNEAEK